jgi:hypothetical protein
MLPADLRPSLVNCCEQSFQLYYDIVLLAHVEIIL